MEKKGAQQGSLRPDIKKDERIYGASLLDIAPTALAMLGLPVGEDMPGKVILSAFDPLPQLETIPSWEEVDGNSGMQSPELETEPEATAGLMDRFVALGYVEDPGSDKEKAANNARIECDYNLAKTYLGSNRPEQALAIMKRLVDGVPWEQHVVATPEMILIDEPVHPDITINMHRNVSHENHIDARARYC